MSDPSVASRAFSLSAGFSFLPAGRPISAPQDGEATGGADCGLCCEAFAEEPAGHVPRLLPCGHTFCHACLEKLVRGRQLECPNRCDMVADIGAEGVGGLQRNFALIDLMRPSGARGAAGAAGSDPRRDELSADAGADAARGEELARLEAAKQRAVEAEDYAEAKRLKDEIDVLRSAVPGAVACHQAWCFDLGGLGQLLHIRPSYEETAGAAAASRRPQAVCVLDRSPSMGQTVIWAIQQAMPQAMQKLGYQPTDPLILITFDSSAERVRIGGRDPLLSELPTIPVKARGGTTLMAKAGQLLAELLTMGGAAYNVFVISDGFLKDMPQTLQRIEAEVPRVAPTARVAFALFRFFNGTPPDTKALAATASLGTIGMAPCTDCIVTRSTLPEAMDAFVSTAEAAFAPTIGRHALLEGGHFRRLPCLTEVPRLELPCDQETLLLVSSPLDEVRIDGRPVQLERAAESLEAIAAFSSYALSQLKLWLVGQVRREHFGQVAGWFRQLAEQQERGTASSNAGLLGRASALLRRRRDDESPLSRIEALVDAHSFVVGLNSKQQGDFLAGGASIGRADRLLLRRGLGSDIVYHDAVRQALVAVAEAGVLDAAPTGTSADRSQDEAPFVSFYSGSDYGEMLRAAALLAPVAEDLLTPEVLQVVGGLGAPFAARLPPQPNAIWELEVTGVDVGAWLGESDVWEATSRGEPLRLAGGVGAVVGVVPLEACGAAAHQTYGAGTLRPVALMQLASQLRGALPEKTWGWDAHAPPFVLEEGVAAREAAVLAYLVSEHVGASKAPSEAASWLVWQLLQQLRPWATAASGAAADAAVPRLRRYAAALGAVGEPLSPGACRALCVLELRAQLQRVGEAEGLSMRFVEGRRQRVMALLARDAAAQVPVVEEAAVIRKLHAELEPATVAEDGTAVAAATDVAPAIDDSVAPTSDLAKRVRDQRWLLPVVDSVLGIVRVQRMQDSSPPEVVSLGTALYGDAAQEDAAWAFLAAALASALESGTIPKAAEEGHGSTEQAAGSPEELSEVLRRQLRTFLEADYNVRLHKEMAEVLLRQREEAKKRWQAAKTAAAAPEVPREAIAWEAMSPLAPAGWGTARGQQHLAFAVCGSCDGGKSTLVGRYLFEIGRLPRQELQKCFKECEAMGKSSFGFAFEMDRTRLERERGVTISVSKRNFHTDRWHCTLVDCPGHKSFIRNMLVGLAQSDVGLLVVPATAGAMEQALARGHFGEPVGEARQHARVLQIYGITQLIVAINKMDATPGSSYSQTRFEEAVAEVRTMLVQVGWKRELVNTRVTFIPVSGWTGDNLVYPSERMPWWKGAMVQVGEAAAPRSVTVMTLAEAFNEASCPPPRRLEAPLRMPITGVFKIKGVGTVVTGRILQGRMPKPGEAVQYVPESIVAGRTRGSQRPLPAYTGQVVSCEMHHQPHENPGAGDIVGVALRGLDRSQMPAVGDVLCNVHESPLRRVSSFEVQVQVMHIPNELRPGWTPMCCAHTAYKPVRLKRILWRMNHDTGGQKMMEPHHLKSGDMAEAEFEPQGPLVLEPHDSSLMTPGSLSRIVLMDMLTVVAIAKVVRVTN